ncbi:MAG TPA: 50S ribosomal protein L6 [Phycisphaerae bacterium]|nr:50S ribosomal protein L6 [Phycisphaerae bacterium]
MSRVGKKPIALPTGVKVDVKGSAVSVTGPKGTLSWSHAAGVSVSQAGGSSSIQVTRASDSSKHRALHGTTRALIQNMIVGVSQGYEEKMEIYGTGYGCSVSGQTLNLTVGYSHPIALQIPAGVKVSIDVPATKGDETPAKLTVTGIDKQVVGQFARSIKDARHPEPYKGKGVRYAGEQIKRKAGKAFAGAGGGAGG